MPFEGQPQLKSREEVPVFETDAEVSYLGVTLEKAENRENAPKRENYTDYINDEFSLELQKKMAVSFLQGDPLLIEGGTSIGKTTTVKKMCAELGWEVHYANLNGATDVEDLMGRYIPNPNRVKIGDPEYIFADGKVTSGLRVEEGKTKVIILDEFNSSAPNILIRLHEVLDALERGGEVVLSEDASEQVKTSREKTKIIALMNPPGKGYQQREVMDPAQLRRWVYQKEVTDLSDETLRHATESLFSLAPKVDDVEKEKYLLSGESTLSLEQLPEIQGLREVTAKYLEFHTAAKELVANRSVAADQPQPFTYDDRMEPRRVRDFILHFYRGDINETIQDALRYYYVGKILDPDDKEKLEELIKHVEYTPPVTASKRKGLGVDPDVVQPPTPETMLPRIFTGIDGALIEIDGRVEMAGIRVGQKLKPIHSDLIGQIKNAKELEVVGFIPDNRILIQIDGGRVVKHSSHDKIEDWFELIDDKKEKISLAEAEKIMGEQFLGPKLIKETFGIEVKIILPIPFSKKELQEAKNRGEELILYVGHMSMKDMYEKYKMKSTDGGKLLYDNDWYKDEDFYKFDNTVPVWKLVSREVIPGTTSKNYLEQTQILIDHLKNEVFKSIVPRDYPTELRVAMVEFNNEKDNIAELLKSNWKKAAEELEKLKITSLTRETPAEVLYRLILSEKKTGKKSLPSTYTWTSKRSSYGKFVVVGYFDSDGVYVIHDAPGRTSSDLGACLSRRG